MSTTPATGPPKHVQRIGRALSSVIVRAPWLWPVLRVPTRRYFDRLAPNWDSRVEADSTQRLAAFAAGLLHVTPAPERALDIGTGTGVGALLLAREFPRASVRGVDIAAEMIAVAQAKVGLDPEGRIAFRVADASSLPYGQDSFDLVTQLNMPPFFAEIARVLRPGGSVVIASSMGPATPFYTSNAALRSGFARHGISEHVAGGAGSGTYWVGRAAG